VYQPQTLRNNEEMLGVLKDIAPDMIVVAAYGKILPESVLNLPKYGSINVHGSLLPRYRGAAPIQWAVLNGDKVTGVTIMYIGLGIDTGDMISKREMIIGDNETAGELFDRMSEVGAELLVDTIPDIVNGTAKREKQDESLAVHAPMINKEMGVMNFENSAEHIFNQVRGLNPWPSAYTSLSGKKMKVFTCRVINKQGKPGLAFVNDGKLSVYCGENALELLEIQPENGKRMLSSSYLLGHPLKEETYFE
ncbi:MAG: methionyl-tRNA formyltransferase, partial [Clostridia bacterium]|nr:methionyl-tRNA formyltransferase [Clostridia bacterium]